MNQAPDTNKKWMRWITALILVCILVFLGVKNVDTVSQIVLWCVKLAFPLVIGVAIALIMDVPMRFLETYLWKNAKSKFWCALRRPISFTLSLLLIIGGLVGIVMVIIPELIESLRIIILGVIDLISKIDAMTQEELAEIPFGNVILAIDWDKTIVSLQSWLKDQSSAIVKGAFSTLSSVITAIFDMIVAFAFAVYLLFSKDKLKRQLTRMVRVWLPERLGGWLMHACSVTCNNFRSFITGQTLEALILGALCMLGMLIFNIPYAPMVSVLVGITALIPVVGGFIGGGIGAFMILTVDPSKSLFFVIFLIILQQLEGNLIYPKVMGHRVHLPGIWILAAVTIGGGVGGPLGMLLGVPITSTAYVLIKEATNSREKESDVQTAKKESTAPEVDLTPIEDIITAVTEPAAEDDRDTQKAQESERVISVTEEQISDTVTKKPTKQTKSTKSAKKKK